MLRKHHTPRYIFNRTRQLIYFKRNPDKPWMTKGSVERLQKLLNKDMNLLEYGAGRSTTFYSRKVKHVVSIETNEDWFNLVKARIDKNVAIFLRGATQQSYLHEASESSFDIIINDAIHRDLVSLQGLDALKSGGILVIDNAERYIPNNFNVPESIGLDINPNWTEFIKSTDGWLKEWYTDGVSCTLFMFKP
jgi:protein-L-isoaspartate O-methyltransferase